MLINFEMKMKNLIALMFLCSFVTNQYVIASVTDNDLNNKKCIAAPVIIGVETEDFQFVGGWTKTGRYKDSSEKGYLFSGAGADLPAVTSIKIPKTGKYTLWVRTVDFPSDRQGERFSSVSVGNKRDTNFFGKSGKEGWAWEKGDVYSLKKGEVLLKLDDNNGIHSSRVDALLLSDDPDFIPQGNLKSSNITLSEISSDMNESVVSISAIKDVFGRKTLAKLENKYLRVSFVTAKRGGIISAYPIVEVMTKNGWLTTPTNPSAESYQVLSAGDAPAMEINGFHPKWKINIKDINVNVNGVKAITRTNANANKIIWNAGVGHEGIVKSVSQLSDDKLKLEFHPTASGVLQAMWELKPEDKTILVTMKFSPSVSGQYSLGYFLFNEKSIDDVEELLLPMLVQRKRFPTENYTLLQAAAPTPFSCMQTSFKEGSITWGVAADPSEIPYEFPAPAKSRFGLHIRNFNGKVQPSIYGPLIGTPDAKVAAGESVKFSFRIYVQPGDWYTAYRTIADDVMNLSDYRENGAVSLTDAAFNMIDLYMDDEYGGWWDRAKAPYQVESLNGSTQSSPLTALSLYYLTGDKNLYNRRTIPTLEFLLSRNGPHFSPFPENTGGYAKGSMNGPLDIFGGAVYGGLWKMTNERTRAFYDIAFPGNTIKPSGTQQNFESHNQNFDELLGRYLATGDKTSLDKAVIEADKYIEDGIVKSPTRELGLNPFFLMSYTPTWEGLLRLYEVTKEKRFLDAAAYGARLVMTGMWTQPVPPKGQVTIHPNGFLHGDKMDRKLHKGLEEFRLGWPRKENDTPEKSVPAWLVSNVGLGFEQPTTYTYKDNGGRMILQAPWATYFLRLALYTGDKQFETYARNAVVGRFGNYPGYYYTTFSDLMQNPRYPYEGPDFGFIYYHHLIVHLSWVLDYLVSDAVLLSKGNIHFPAVRQYGYAYFDNLIYGHAPGEIYGQKNAWLWFNKNLIALDNSQINYLTAHNENKFFVVLMNQSHRTETVSIAFKPENISKAMANFSKMKVISGESKEIMLSKNKGEVTLAPRGIMVLEVDGLDIDIAAHRSYALPEKCTYQGTAKTMIGKDMEVHAASIQIEPGTWNAYVWSNAGSGSLKEINLNWTIGSQTGTIKDIDYPYEFSVPVKNGEKSFKFFINGIKADNTTYKSEEMTIGVAD
jgi:hypothetical protein